MISSPMRLPSAVLLSGQQHRGAMPGEQPRAVSAPIPGGATRHDGDLADQSLARFLS